MSTEIETGTACPICKTVPDRDTGRCRCPRVPSYRVPMPSLASETLVTQAESLFENYIAARLVRTRRALTAAKVALLRDPRNRAKLDALRTAEAETERLQAQLLEQSRRTVAARERAASVPASNEPPRARTSSEATEDFRSRQAAKADAAYRSPDAADSERVARADERECPNCGERHRSDTSICVCGYNFVAPEHNMVAEPFLTAEEVAALRSKPSKRPG